MSVDIAGYLSEIQRLHASGQATEHTYRPALQKLFDSITNEVKAYNEPKGVKVGRPDFVFIREAGKNAQITVGHCEAKDIGLGISPKGMNDFNKAQHDRYVKALPNLIYTNALDFRFYKKGELVREISIADFLMGVKPKPDQFSTLENLLKDFCAERLQTITSAEKLAEMMAGKAVLIKDILSNSLKEDKDLQNELTDQYKSFKEMLIHDLSTEDFADIYAETIAYGMFGARLHDKSLDSFSRAEALDLMPKSNPFLRNLFTYVAGPQLDERIRRTVDELAEIFQATNLPKLFEDFGKFTQRNDPFIHFYETFLAEYNPAKRKARGVWYTPEPVVNFIVRAVDDVLKTEFGLADGLADTSKVTVDWDTGQTDKKGKHIIEKKTVHRVQILDPAAGTGTFLAEVIKQIAPKVKDVAEGQWSAYVEKELIPRLHGFELLMASYAMCHMKLDMMLTEMGYKPTGNPPRLGVYLTNSLEEGERANQTLPFAQWLSNEAKEANTIKRDMPIMCVIGNPPYSVSSSNRGQWIVDLLAHYKSDLNEQNIQPLSDDYIKFFRLGHFLIEKNGEGVLAVITNNSYLDGLIHRQMRKTLMEYFDTIYISDLHGSTKRKETTPNGVSDTNVFDIQQGVSIAIMVKKIGMKQVSSQNNIFHRDIWGSRSEKYNCLFNDEPLTTNYQKLFPVAPYYFFAPKDFAHQQSFELGFKLDELFVEFGSGVSFRKDNLLVKYNFAKSNVLKMIEDMRDLEPASILQKYSIRETSDWTIAKTRQHFEKNINDVQAVNYRPFDKRYCYFPFDRIHLIIPRGDHRRNLMRHMNAGENIAFNVCRQFSGNVFRHCFVSDCMNDLNSVSLETRERSYCAPLYLYPEPQDLDQTRRVNFDPKIHKAIVAAVVGDAHDITHPLPPSGRTPPAKLREKGEVPDEIAIFDYIYGVLHCPAYRETYKEFLKIDFPRVPYPPSPEVFWDVSAKGTELRKLHLMEDAAIGSAPYKFTGTGDTIVGKVKFEGGRVAINDGQGFDGVPDIAWNFYIGGYQPAQKWLKDRKGRELSYEDIKHYQKIIKILSETDRIMKTITMPL